MELVNLLKENMKLEQLYYIYILFVGVDIVTGMIKAWQKGNFKSRTLRNGLFVSLGEMVFLALAAIVATLIPIAELPVFFIFVTMSIKELSSVVENLVEIGVPIPAWLCRGLNVYNERLDNLDKKEGDKL